MSKLDFYTAVEIDGQTTGGSFYVYSPDHPHDYDMLSNFMNGMIFVYPDSPVISTEEADSLLNLLDLKTIAENFPAYVILPCPLEGEKWSPRDIDLFYEIQYYMAGGRTMMGDHGPETVYPRRTTNTLLTVMAEGSGADFVHQTLSLHTERVAGILTFGGHGAVANGKGCAVPAWLVNADEAVKQYYLQINGCDTLEGEISYNSENPLKKVVTISGTDRFDKEMIRTAWDAMLSRITRLGVSANLVFDLKNPDEWVLMDWPNPDDLHIRVESYSFDPASGIAEPLPLRRTESIRDIHIYIPDSVQESNEPVPLVFVLHGSGDDPLNVTAGCGWVQKAAKEKLILAAPADEETATIVALYRWICDRYPVDRRRVYVVGFSMGGMFTAQACKSHPELFAAMVPMASGGGDLCEYHSTEYMPACMLVGSADVMNFGENEDGTRTVRGLIPGSVDQNFEINGIHPSSVADASVPYWGKKPTAYRVLHDKGLEWQVSDYCVPDCAAPVVRTITLIGAGHSNADYMAEVTWEFMRRFAREADGTLTVLPE